MKVEKLELNHKGMKELLRSEEAKLLCKELTDKAAAELGEGYESEGFIGPNKANAEIQAVTWEAVNGNKKDNRMLKAVLKK